MWWPVGKRVGRRRLGGVSAGYRGSQCRRKEEAPRRPKRSWTTAPSSWPRRTWDGARTGLVPFLEVSCPYFVYKVKLPDPLPLRRVPCFSNGEAVFNVAAVVLPVCPSLAYSALVVMG